MKNIFKLITAIFLITLSACDQTPQFSSELFNNISFRHVGHGRGGGRISDIEVINSNPSLYYVSTSTGGVWKTENAGKDFSQIFDDVSTSLSIGDMAICQTEPNTIWVGTGEASGEQSPASIGDGIYKSVNGGKSWQFMGLEHSRHIARIAIDPTNTDIVYVAATGSRWGANSERGLYKTSDGGKTWSQVIFISVDTGFGDVCVSNDGKTVLASAYQRRRTAWGALTRGPESALYRSTDSGNTFTKITDNLPTKKVGRIAIAFAESDNSRVYINIDSDKKAGTYRSDDFGATWKFMNGDYTTMYWYGRIYVHPTNKNRMWVMGTHIGETKDGGETFARLDVKNIHVDHHTIWMNSADSSHSIIGNDGGVYSTNNGGDNWDYMSNIPANQFYNISINNEDPYIIYGGLQDNGVWGWPSKSYGDTLINNNDAFHLTGGDGFYSTTDINNTEIVYSESQYGVISRLNTIALKQKKGLTRDEIKELTPEEKKEYHNLRRNARKGIQPKAEGDEKYRFNWNAPFFVSSHKPHELYIGANKLLMSPDMGDNWNEISDDLTYNNCSIDSLILGLRPARKPYSSIVELSESPLKKGVIYTGSDDGKIMLTKDNGDTWEDISNNIPMPKDRFASTLLASTHDLATAYFSCWRQYEADDFKPHIYKTTDFGKTWISIASNLPTNKCVNTIAEHPDNPNLLFVGVNNGLFISINGGGKWSRAGGNMPFVAIHDIEIAKNDNDLVLGSYGRGVIILDDMSFLSELNAEILNNKSWIFTPRTQRTLITKDAIKSSAEYSFNVPNPEKGLLINYYLKKDNKKGFLIKIIDDKGLVIDEIKASGNKGFNRTYWQNTVKGNFVIVHDKQKVSFTI